ncbi:hypothetical protein DFH29DRAFT_52796 [Suillus ampliporus]|nr:hypothetical protein DFH29DRAFT_52796 [Suillus ampliporus]
MARRSKTLWGGSCKRLWLSRATLLRWTGSESRPTSIVVCQPILLHTQLRHAHCHLCPKTRFRRRSPRCKMLWLLIWLRNFIPCLTSWEHLISRTAGCVCLVSHSMSQKSDGAVLKTRRHISAYKVKADGLRDLMITTEDKLTQFSRARPSPQTFLLVRPWDPYLLELPDFAGDLQSMDNWSVRGSLAPETLSMFSSETEPIGLESDSRALRLIVRLGQPFRAFLLARQRGGEYKRIISDCDIIAQVKDMAASVPNMMDVRPLEIS